VSNISDADQFDIEAIPTLWHFGSNLIGGEGGKPAEGSKFLGRLAIEITPRNNKNPSDS
jgi:hypothetical protein